MWHWISLSVVSEIRTFSEHCCTSAQFEASMLSSASSKSAPHSFLFGLPGLLTCELSRCVNQMKFNNKYWKLIIQKLIEGNSHIEHVQELTLGKHFPIPLCLFRAL